MVQLDIDAISTYGCNIASGVIIEKFALTKLTKFKYLVNSITLFRNFVNCLSGTSLDTINIFKSGMARVELLNSFISDTKIFIEAVLSLGIDLVIYVPDYSKVKSKYFNFRSLEENSGLKFHMRVLEEEVGRLLLENFTKIVVKYKHKLPYTKDMYITTHIAMDLLSYTSYRNVKLIESHTAETKTKELWYTKYYKLPKKDMSIFPFNEALYFVLGDQNYIKPHNIKVRKLLYTIGIKSKWSSGMDNLRLVTSIAKQDVVLGKEIKIAYKSIY